MRNFNELTITDAVIDRIKHTPDSLHSRKRAAHHSARSEWTSPIYSQQYRRTV